MMESTSKLDRRSMIETEDQPNTSKNTPETRDAGDGFSDQEEGRVTIQLTIEDIASTRKAFIAILLIVAGILMFVSGGVMWLLSEIGVNFVYILVFACSALISTGGVLVWLYLKRRTMEENAKKYKDEVREDSQQTSTSRVSPIGPDPKSEIPPTSDTKPGTSTEDTQAKSNVRTVEMSEKKRGNRLKLFVVKSSTQSSDSGKVD